MRIINFFDGSSSETVPTIGNIVASALVNYANDAAYEAAEVGSPVQGNVYFNTTTKFIRYYNGTAWINLADVSSVQTFTNKTIGDTNTINAQDDAFSVQDATDPTKQIDFNAAGTTGTKTTIASSQTANRVVNLPDATDTLMGKATTDTMTNKTFDADGTGNNLSNVDDGNIKSGANISRAKLASGSVNHVIINDGSGVLSSEAALSPTRGGTGIANNAAQTITRSGLHAVTLTTTATTSVTLPASGTLATLAGVETLSSKTLSSPAIGGFALFSGGSAARFQELAINGINYMAIVAPDAVTANVTLKLPNGDGTARQFLNTNGTGSLGWAHPDGDDVTIGPITNLSATNAEAAFAEHQDNIDDLEVLSGRPTGSTDLGTFTGTTIPDSSTIKSALQSLETSVETKESSANKGIAGGYASLDGGGKVPISQLPASIMEYKGNWNASTNSPTLIDGTGDTGDVYRVSVAGTQNLGSGSQTFAVGDWVVYNGTIWQLSSNGTSVVSVNTFTGAVVLTTTDIAEGTNLYFTNERAQDAVGNILTDSATVDFTYDDAGNTISAIVPDDAITNTKLSNMATQTIKGRTTAGTGDPEDLTATQATAILNQFVGDTGAGGTKGLVTTPAIGDATKFLRGDATWQSVGAASEYVAPNTQLNLAIFASAAANALTLAIKAIDGTTDPSVGTPVKLAFRVATNATGGFVIRSVESARSTTISSGSTAGHASGKEEYLYVYALDNSGTVEVAWSSSLFDCNVIQSTTAEGGAGGAGSATTLYSTTARTNVSIVLLGKMKITQTTAGTWVNAPSVISIPECPRYTLGSVQVFTNDGTWTKPSGCKAVSVRLVGAGGGGGGADGGGGTGSSAGAGGGGGGYSQKWITRGLGATETVSVGTGGGAGAGSGGATGGAGTSTSFGAHLSATGGGGGGGDTAPTTSDTRNQTSGGSGGSGSGGDVNLTGFRGSVGISFGVAGNSIGGGGGAAPVIGGSPGYEKGGNLAGIAGDFGGGGSGGSVEGSTTDRDGGGGGNGLIIVEEYY